MDVISMHQAGFNNAVASLGTALTSLQAGLMKRYTDEVLVIYDSDEAGVKAALRAIPMLKGVGLTTRVVNLRRIRTRMSLSSTRAAKRSKNVWKRRRTAFCMRSA